MSNGGRSSTRRHWVIAAVVVGALGALVVGAPFWASSREWQRLDRAADDFRIPSGLTEVARPRQGQGFCWVTCTNGGEAVVTIVLETDHTDPAEACDELRQAVADLTDGADEVSHRDQHDCGWSGELGGAATVFASAARRESFGPNDGHRRTEEVPVPDSPVVAFVEFSSGLE